MTGIGSRFELPNGADRSIACWLGALAGRNLELLLWVTLDSDGSCVTAAIAPNTQISRTSQRSRTAPAADTPENRIDVHGQRAYCPSAKNWCTIPADGLFLFSAYLERKRGVPLTGDLLTDFAAGWDMHIGFGVENPVRYALMYAREEGRRSRAAQTAEAQLRRGLEQLASAGLLRIGVNAAVAVTTAMAIGCVTQLIHGGGAVTGPVARSMRAALMSELTGHSPERNDTGPAARLLLARLGSAPGLFTPAEEALLRQWLHTLSEHFGAMPGDAGRGVAMPELRPSGGPSARWPTTS